MGNLWYQIQVFRKVILDLGGWGRSGVSLLGRSARGRTGRMGYNLSPPGPEALHKDSLPSVLWGSINVPNKNGNLISLISSEEKVTSTHEKFHGWLACLEPNILQGGAGD